ncbi:hypothetical protein I1A_000717 [Pseudomonas fluorescens R124]|uniref:Uncharacterized protein n=1 Tax=Pseudomonas fluorescens R124 TaxID=743713 RepID=A0A7U9GR09_PSEFL|nr:hypothetical protein [Pseudomonas fluorescens]EJZ56409.1 hypothetical protein I1A_000717 [Pseudomonas fluorescens R124]
MLKCISGYYPSFSYGGLVADADEGDTVNGRPPYLLEQPYNISSNFVAGRGVQLSLDHGKKPAK